MNDAPVPCLLSGQSRAMSGWPAFPGSGNTETLATIPEQLDLAWQYHQAGQWARAEELYRQIVQEQPAQAGAWVLLGEACLYQGKFGQAEAGYRQALALCPEQAEAWNNLGVALARQGKPAEAAACYR